MGAPASVQLPTFFSSAAQLHLSEGMHYALFHSKIDLVDAVDILLSVNHDKILMYLPRGVGIILSDS